jgi:hypothetical protein
LRPETPQTPRAFPSKTFLEGFPQESEEENSGKILGKGNEFPAQGNSGGDIPEFISQSLVLRNSLTRGSDEENENSRKSQTLPEKNSLENSGLSGSSGVNIEISKSEVSIEIVVENSQNRPRSKIFLRK